MTDCARSGDLLIRALPDASAWAADALQLEKVPRFAAGAAHRQHGGAFVVPGLAFEVAAEALALVTGSLAAAPAAGGGLQLLVLAAHQVDALRQVRDAVHQAAAGDDDAEDLLDTLHLLLAGGVLHPGLTPEGVTARLDRLLAVLDLDLPTARMLAASHLSGRPDTLAARTQLADAWRKAGTAP